MAVSWCHAARGGSPRRWSTNTICVTPNRLSALLSLQHALLLASLFVPHSPIPYHSTTSPAIRGNQNMNLFVIDRSVPPVPASTVDREAATIMRAQLLDPPDFTISIEIYTWSVHSRRLTSSKFFQKLCDGPFLESGSRLVTLHDDDPICVARLILWFYYGRYPVDAHDRPNAMPSIGEFMASGCKESSGTFILPTSNPDRTVSQNFKHVGYLYSPHYDMFMLADKYDIPELRQYCVKQLRGGIAKAPGFVFTLDDFRLFLEERGIEAADIERFVEQELVNNARAYIKFPRFKQMIKSKPDFAWMVVKVLAGGNHGAIGSRKKTTDRQ